MSWAAVAAAAVAAGGSIYAASKNKGSQASTTTPAYGPHDLAHFYEIANQSVGGAPTAPSYQAPEALRTLNDTYGTPAYNALETNLAATPLRRLSEDRDTASARYLAQMRKIGMADDPARFQLQEETIDRPYSRNVTDVLSNAAAQTGQLALGESTALNTADTTRNAIQNQFRLGLNTNAVNQYLGQIGNYYKPATVNLGTSTGTTGAQMQNPFGLNINIADLLKQNNTGNQYSGSQMNSMSWL